MGILNLIKNHERQKALETAENQVGLASLKLQQAMAEIAIKTAQIERLQSNIVLLENKIKDTASNEINNRIKNINRGKAKDMLNGFFTAKKQNVAKDECVINLKLTQ